MHIRTNDLYPVNTSIKSVKKTLISFLLKMNERLMWPWFQVESMKRCWSTMMQCFTPVRLLSFQCVLLIVWNIVSVGRVYEDWFRFWVSKHIASQVRHSFITSITFIALIFSHPPPQLYGAVKPRRLSLPPTRSAPSLWQGGSRHKHISQSVSLNMSSQGGPSAQMVRNSSDVMETCS